MRLSRLELKGFKSFRDKIVLKFPDKFMGVVGPNGSGKSNITEAICFVLGKSRGLRAANMAELIFNGAVGGEPAKKAVVVLTLEEDNGAKHKVTRIIEADGTSIYKLNDKRSTRSKILEIVGDSEYNILLQDDITKAVELKPKDRRKVIDDLCGIGSYDEKRDKALRELEKGEERIKDTSIILGTKAGYLTNLREERDEALKFQNTRQHLNSTQATIIDKEIKSNETRDVRLRSIISEIDKSRAEGAEKIQSLETDIIDAEKEKSEIDQELISLERQRSGAQIAQARGELLRLSDKISYITDEITKFDSENLEKKGLVEAFTFERMSLEESHSDTLLKRDIKVKEIGVQTEKASNPELESEFDECKESLYEMRSKIGATRQLIDSKQSELGGLMSDQQTLESQMKQGIVLEDVKQREKTSLSYEQARADMTRFSSEYDQANDSLTKAQDSLNTERIALEKKKSELATAMRASGGLQRAVRAVIELKKVIPGINGPVMQLGQITDDLYTTAISEASRGRMQNVVVSTVDDASKCIDYLRKKQVGRCTFLPIDKLNPRVSGLAPEGSIGFVREFVKCSKKFEKVFEYVFGDTIIVNDISSAKKIGIGNWRMVTLDGDLMELSGAMSGGYRSKGIEINFSNVGEFEKEISAIEFSVTSLEQMVEGLKEERSSKDRTLQALRERIRTSKDELDSMKLEAGIATERRSSLRDNLNRIVESINCIDHEIVNANVDSKSFSKQEAALSKKLQDLDIKRDKGAKTKLDQLKEDLAAQDVELATGSQKISSIEERISEANARMEGLSVLKSMAESQLENIKTEKSTLESSISGLEKVHDTLDGKIEEVKEKRESIEQSMFSASKEKAEIAGTLEASRDKLQDHKIEMARTGEKLDSLRKSFKVFEGVELVDKSMKDLLIDVEKLEEKMTKFDNVNLKAVDAYDEVEKEINDIQEKMDTLKTERESIMDFMDKIEAKKRTTFMEAFDIVKSNFERIFADLSDGKGTLIIDDPMNISDAGLIIKASPGGKKLMSLEQMSGGEKVLTSTAFLLALQQYKPAFFYIVDELDAALDHRNSIRLAQMLRNSSSQFLMVTHNNNMLRYMNSAIGVSMVKGVSSIVGVRFEETPDSDSVLQGPGDA